MGKGWSDQSAKCCFTSDTFSPSVVPLARRHDAHYPKEPCVTT